MSKWPPKEPIKRWWPVEAELNEMRCQVGFLHSLLNQRETEAAWLGQQSGKARRTAADGMDARRAAIMHLLRDQPALKPKQVHGLLQELGFSVTLRTVRSDLLALQSEPPTGE